MNIIKKRKGKISKRGIFLMDKELKKTSFQIGSHYKYIIDKKNKKVIILNSEDDKDNTVCKKKTNYDLLPVIDIRKKDAKDIFNICDYLQITIYVDKIVVEGYKEDKKTTVNKKESFLNKTVNFFKKNIKDITQILNIKKCLEVSLSSKNLDKLAVNGFEQISFDNYLDSISNDCILNNSFKVASKTIPAKINPLIKVASLFSGAGLMDLGFLQEGGFDIIFALDIDKDACETYKYNIGNHILCNDINNIDKNSIPKVPIMIGGPPCQGFSNANRINNYLDNPKNALVKQYIEAIKANKECKVFVLENVPQILTAGKGKFKKEILDSLSDFKITYGVVSSADMGSPQDRKRAIFIGSKIGEINLPKALVSSYKTVRQAFHDINENTPNQKDCAKSKLETIEKMKYIPQGGNVFNIPENIRPKGKHSCFYKRLSWDLPSITIVNVSRSMILHPEKNRLISVREAASIQDVPNNYIFKGSLFSKYQQVANGVPVLLSKAIAAKIKKAFTNLYLKECSNLQLV